MGKPSSTKKKTTTTTTKQTDNGVAGKSKPKALDKDMDVFISMSQELKEEGNKLFQKRDHEGAMLKYEKALNLLPTTPATVMDVASLRTNMAACYMQMGLGEYPRAITQCDLALQVCPRYTKALLKRSKCHQALNRFDFAFKDVNSVLKSEPHNLVALELAQRLKETLEKMGLPIVDGGGVEGNSDAGGGVVNSKAKPRRKRKNKAISDENKKKEDDKITTPNSNPNPNPITPIMDMEEEMVGDDRVVTETKTVKLVFGEDIRLAKLPTNCSLQHVKDIVQERFECEKPIIIKYKDGEGDLVTITSDEELRLAEDSVDSSIRSVKLFVFQISPDIEEEVDNIKSNHQNGDVKDVKETNGSYIEDWIIQFAQVFKNHVGFNSDEYLDLHELTMKLHSDAMEDMITSEDAQDIFNIAADNFQEMAALALFNWGNVHLSRARKKVGFEDEEDDSSESILLRVKSAYEWAKKEYVKAGKRYEEALRIKPEFYEAHLAMGLQQFEQAKLSWCYAIGCGVDLDTWSSTEVLELFDNAEDNIENGTQMWEEQEKQRVNQLSKNDVFGGMAAEQSTNVRSQINLLWGIILYERSLVEFKLGLPAWKECLEVAVEKFQLTGVSSTDIAVIIKNHCANQTAGQGLGFKVDEIVQAWNEMHNAKRWKIGVPSFRLESLFRRQIPKLHHDLEHASLLCL